MIVNKEVKINKIDDDKKQVEVIVRVPDIPDADGDITTAEDIEAMAHSYPFWGNVDAYHNFNRVGNFVESYVLKEDRTEQLPNGRTMVTPKGTWIAVLSVKDQAVWENVKNGQITGASLVAVPGNILTEDGTLIPLKERKWEVDQVFADSSEGFEEKMRRIDMIFSQKAAEQGKGGGTTLNAIKNLGLGLEVIDISLVKAPNQSEAQVLSLKSVGEMIAKATATLKQEFISKFRSIKETIADEDRQEGDEIMTKEQLLEALKDESVISVLKEVLVESTEKVEDTKEPDAVETESKTDEVEDKTKETKEDQSTEIDQEKEDLKKKVSELTEKVEQLTSVKSRAINDADPSTKSTVVKRLRKDGPGRKL